MALPEDAPLSQFVSSLLQGLDVKALEQGLTATRTSTAVHAEPATIGLLSQLRSNGFLHKAF